MHLRLKIVHGALRTPRGRSAGRAFSVPVQRFVIGTATDCHMRCSGHSISPYHCVILIENDRVIVEDRGSEGGTYVNGVRLTDTACLFHGDRLRVGKLEFEVEWENDPKPSQSESSASPPEPTPVPGLPHRETVTESIDTVADLVVDILVNADQEERDRRRFDPAAREFRSATSPVAESDTPEKKPDPSAQPAIPQTKRPPGKLPPAPPIRGQDTVDAAHQALAHLIDPARKKKPN